jgi:hypothetical protein
VAYKYTTGSVERGDIYNQNDVQGNTYLDWSEDAIGIVAGGELAFTISGSNNEISSSYNLSASAFYGDGSNLENVTATASPAGSNAQIQFNDNGSTGAAAQLYWHEGNNRLGIGTNNPSKALDIEDADSAGIQLNATNHRAYTVASDAYGFIVHDNTTGGTGGYRFVISDQTDYLGYVGIGDGVGIAANAHPKALLHLSSSDDQALLRVDTTGGSNASTVLFVTGSGRVGIGTSTPASTLDISGSVGTNIVKLVGSVTVDTTHHTVLMGNSNTTTTCTLPAAASCAGRIYIFKRISSSATCKLNAASGENIDDDVDAELSFDTQYDVKTVQSDGTAWWIINEVHMGQE